MLDDKSFSPRNVDRLWKSFEETMRRRLGLGPNDDLPTFQPPPEERLGPLCRAVVVPRHTITTRQAIHGIAWRRFEGPTPEQAADLEAEDRRRGLAPGTTWQRREIEAAAALLAVLRTGDLIAEGRPGDPGAEGCRPRPLHDGIAPEDWMGGTADLFAGTLTDDGCRYHDLRLRRYWFQELWMREEFEEIRRHLPLEDDFDIAAHTPLQKLMKQAFLRFCVADTYPPTDGRAEVEAWLRGQRVNGKRLDERTVTNLAYILVSEGPEPEGVMETVVDLILPPPKTVH